MPAQPPRPRLEHLLDLDLDALDDAKAIEVIGFMVDLADADAVDDVLCRVVG